MRFRTRANSTEIVYTNTAYTVMAHFMDPFSCMYHRKLIRTEHRFMAHIHLGSHRTGEGTENERARRMRCI